MKLGTLAAFAHRAECARGIPSELTRAVVHQLGGWNGDTRQNLRDAARNGIDGGFHGFTYYTDTVKFARKHFATICNAMRADRESAGEPATLAQFIAEFRCLDLPIERVELALMNCNPDQPEVTQIYNALAWYAAETVARAYEDACEEPNL